MVKRKTKPNINRKKIIIYALTIVLSVVYIIVGRSIAMEGYPYEAADGSDVLKVKVTELISDEQAGDVRTLHYDARVMAGEQKGQLIHGNQEIDYNYYPVQEPVEEGDRILVFANTYTEGIDWTMLEYVRSDKLLILALVFFAALLAFGRLKGLNTIIALAFTCLAVFAVFVPAVLSRQNIYMWAIVTCLYVIVMTMLVINGAGKKSFAAGLGCFCGVLIAGLLTVLMNDVMQMTGMISEDTLYLNMLDSHGHIDLLGIIFASITIGALGAVMDVAMDISSSLNELRINVPDIDSKRLIRSGFNIGRDVMGTMANTLVLAYIGSSLATTLLLVSYNYSAAELFNMELIVFELMQALAGSIGILLSIPMTSFICAFLYPKKKSALVEK